MKDLKDFPENLYVEREENPSFQMIGASTVHRSDLDVGYIRADLAIAAVDKAKFYLIKDQDHGMLDWEKIFPVAFHDMQARVHQTAVDHGWWEQERNDGECIALMHSELSEALEELRKPVSSYASEIAIRNDQIAKEFADVIIRIMDFAQARGYDVATAIVEKDKINQARPYKHGKKF